MQGKGGDVIQAIWQAKEYRPDGIVAATDLRDQVCVEDAASSVVYPYPRLNEIARGIRRGELVTVTAGSGSGKSTFIREIAYSLHQAGERVGMIMLEESNKRTLLGLVGLHMNKNVLVDRSDVTTEEIEETFTSLFNSSTQPLYMYDHFGSNEVELICKRIEFMCKALDVKYVFLDHISILISGLATNDERKLIDMAMTRLRTLVQELDICLFLVSHLRRPEGDRGHEDGSKVRLGQLRGSHAIAQLSDICIGIQVSAEDPDSDQRELKILKNRFTGKSVMPDCSSTAEKQVVYSRRITSSKETNMNKFKRVAFDIETNGLLDTMDTLHCLCVKCLESGETQSFYGDTLPTGIAILTDAEEVIGHNIIAFDLPAIRLVYPDFTTQAVVTDTLVLSRLMRADIKNEDFEKYGSDTSALLPRRLFGSHSLAAWGLRMGNHKGDYTGGWEAFSQEMLEYCEQDVEVTHLYNHLDVAYMGCRVYPC